MSAVEPGNFYPVGHTLAEVEEWLIDQTLLLVNGHKDDAAKVLGISRKTLYRRLEARERSNQETV